MSARHALNAASRASGVSRKQFLRTTLAGLLGAALPPTRLAVPAAARQGGALACRIEAEATGWTRFRGPNGTGVGAGSGYPSSLAPETLLWRRSIPAGKSSPVFAASSLFLTGERGETPVVMCLDRATGATRWERAFKPGVRAIQHPLNHLAAPSGVTDGDNFYAFFDHVGLVSVDASGKERWRVPLERSTAGWGPGSSPVLVNGTLVLLQDGYGRSRIAGFDPATGKLSWETERLPGHNYSTPVVRTGPDGMCEIIVTGPLVLAGLDPRDGKQRWAGDVPGGSIVATPAVHEDIVITTSYAGEGAPPPLSDWIKVHDKNGDRILQEGEYGRYDPILRQLDRFGGDADGTISEEEWNRGTRELNAGFAGRSATTAVRLVPAKDGRVEPTKLWEEFRNVPHVPSPLVHEGVLYLAANGVILTTLDVETGRLHKRGRVDGLLGSCYASPVAADGKLFVISEEGAAAVISAKSQWEILSVNQLGEACYATPALVEGRVFVRTADSLASFGERAPKRV